MVGLSNSLELDMNNDYARLAIEEEEDGGLIIASDEATENGEIILDSCYCLVGRFLTENVVNFGAMKNMMASLWRPRGGGLH